MQRCRLSELFEQCVITFHQADTLTSIDVSTSGLHICTTQIEPGPFVSVEMVFFNCIIRCVCVIIDFVSPSFRRGSRYCLSESISGMRSERLHGRTRSQTPLSRILGGLVLLLLASLVIIRGSHLVSPSVTSQRYQMPKIRVSTSRSDATRASLELGDEQWRRTHDSVRHVAAAPSKNADDDDTGTREVGAQRFALTVDTVAGQLTDTEAFRRLARKRCADPVCFRRWNTFDLFLPLPPYLAT